MKRFLLLSSGLEYIKEYVGQDPTRFSMLFIPTAGNPDTDVWWIDKDREALREMGFNIRELDITGKTVQELTAAIESTDIVYIAGGYTYYLLRQLRETGFDHLLTDYVEQGGLFAGASAGALIAGVDIAPIAAMDEPGKAGGPVSSEGLSLINIVPIPHYDMPERAAVIDEIEVQFGAQYQIAHMTDDQAILVEGNDWKLVDSPRNERELEWFNRHS